MKPITAGDFVDMLSTMPREARVLLEVKGASWAEIVGVRLEPKNNEPSQYCDDHECESCTVADKEREAYLMRPRAVLLASDDDQVNKLAGAVDALVAAAPDKRAALRVKSEAGIYLSPDDLRALEDAWEEAPS